MIDAVGVDAERPKRGPAAEESGQLEPAFRQEIDGNAPRRSAAAGSAEIRRRRLRHSTIS